MSDLFADTLIGAYRLVGRAAVPFMPLALSWRARHGKEDRTRSGERFGRAGRIRPPGRLVWVHAASVGETNAVMPLIERITVSGIGVLLTTVTVTSAEIAERRLPGGAIHQFAPLDAPQIIGRFLDHWRPELALFVESELWPTTISKLAAANVPVVLVNARLSERSFRTWSRLGGVARSILGRISLCLAQTAQDAERYASLNVSRVVVTGNLKFDTPAPEVEAAALDAFRAAVGDRPVWVAASTHSGEEAAVGEAHRRLKDRFYRLLTVVVPRHPARGDEIRAELESGGLPAVQRSAGEEINELVEIYIADTLDELGLFYRVAPIAFLGGSLIRHGGQNPIEPVKLGAAVLHGPHVYNFAEIYAAIDGVDETPTIVDSAGLAEAVGAYLAEPAERDRYVDDTAVALAPFGGALEKTLSALGPYLAGGRE